MLYGIRYLLLGLFLYCATTYVTFIKHCSSISTLVEGYSSKITMGKSAIRTVGKVDLEKPASTQSNLHVSLNDVSYSYVVDVVLVADRYIL